MTSEVFVTRTGAFLPFAPVGNKEMEDILGRVGGKPSRARRLVLRANGILSRHYAIDRATGEPAMSNAQLTAAAIRDLGDIGKVDCLASGTSLPDQMMPNHAVMVHGELGWPRLEVVSCAGVCLAGTAALKYAWLALRAGDAHRAVASGSACSPVLLARTLTPKRSTSCSTGRASEIAFEKSSCVGCCRRCRRGAAGNRSARALVLAHRLVELFSAAHELPVCMYAGADKTKTAHCAAGCAIRPPNGSKSIFAIKQDVRLSTTTSRALAGVSHWPM